MTELPIVFRNAKPEDLPLIYSSWLKSYRDSDFARSMTDTVYFKGHRQVLEGLVARCMNFVACDAEDPDHIYGWICASKNADGSVTLHYVYVKHAFRGMGIGKRLFELVDTGKPFTYSHQGRLSDTLKARGTYSPYAVLGVK